MHKREKNNKVKLYSSALQAGRHCEGEKKKHIGKTEIHDVFFAFFSWLVAD